MGSEEGYIFGANRTRTICEVLRDINDELQGNSEEHRDGRDLVVNAMLLSKKMVSALGQLKRAVTGNYSTVSEEMFEDNPVELNKKAREIRSNPDYKVGSVHN
jgi:hypothetical protein